MANLKISELTEASVINPADDLVVVQGGTTKRAGFDTLMYSINGLMPWGRPPSFTDTYDCQFEQSLGNWTAVLGTPGTISLLETSTSVAKYDITTLKRGLLMQCGHSQKVSFRADRTLADGEGVTAMFWLPGPLVSSGDNCKFVLGLNVDDSDMEAAAEGLWLGLEQDTSGLDIQLFPHDGATGGSTMTSLNANLSGGWLAAVRIIRSGLTFVGFVSFGGGWQPLTPITTTQAMTNIWLAMTGSSAGQTYMPVGGVAWVKIGAAAWTPW